MIHPLKYRTGGLQGGRGVGGCGVSKRREPEKYLKK